MLEFKLPEIGEGVVEGEIVRWHKQPGEAVQANEALVEVMTDKATIEVPSPVAAIVRELKAQVGDICAVEQVIAILEVGAARPAASAAAPVATAAAAPAAAPSNMSSGPVLATPAARALAREEGIDLRGLPTDDRGRITKQDVLKAAEAAKSPAPSVAPRVAAPPVVAPPVAAAVSGKAPPAPPTTPSVAAKPAPAPAPAAAVQPAAQVRQPHAAEAAPDDEVIPFRGMRRRIAEAMTRSYTSAVHYTYVEQVNVTKLVRLRQEAKAAAAEQGVSLTFLPFIVKAVVHALKKYPIVNSELDEAGGRILVKKRYNIGVAAATDQGLMVPVVHGADRLSILEIGREIARLGEAAKNGTAKREDLTGGTFTISSLGNIGGVLATPIINFPEVGILGVHAIRKTPIVDDNNNIVVGHLMNLSVSLDHRVVDGFEGANFLQEVRRFLEDPNLLLLAGI
ncbi:pyruvate dehydrogenase E2 component (dihydrolipoamide acetyltransferase) [Nannocystis exedens]|uniref:Dihydrolipoamide acetyltransferase component of pyruvate dehydrogenase complex n=1 Tax=Nannocystis exedens TaxID=54 RepID=A0A1I2C4S1_9BACT|nr:dihydrolipoamide acetyltransferase family protein [Nannocystis exedens]PCC71066.1 alpha keto acid dehydrogenase complex, E2 component, dihydrolipoamide acetyltransferase [Nannocystis exedens]SFE63198.1 pyruvate dehydrogenase E2 component (dihydrolipoamide acetyltransferase) [Nannocystis exedens]